MNQMDTTEEQKASESFTMKYIAFSQQNFQKHGSYLLTKDKHQSLNFQGSLQ